MRFQVLDRTSDAQLNKLPTAVLVTDSWDDWFRYSTMYTLFVFDEKAVRHRIGSVKIGQFDMKLDQRRPAVPAEFENLGDRFFSLGQDDTYYESLNQLGAEIRDQVLTALVDLALADPELLRRARKESVTNGSLFRSVSEGTLDEQFRRIARGGARLTKYSFVYDAPPLGRGRRPAVSFSFEVEPESQPPTNVHVIIGRNGVGKTHLLNGMARALVTPHEDAAGTFRDLASSDPNTSFANLVSVTFSAFDPFEPLTSDQNRKSPVRFAYIGLKRAPGGDEDKVSLPKTPQMLGAEFSRSAKLCRKGERAVRWARALRMLESDPIFKDARVATMAPLNDEDDSTDSNPVAGVFSRLSSGHKIVLLTITRLVETVAERTLVLLDEPEAHLHPPLLSAFVRALSELLVDRNGVAIIATHSPVVVQEVPKRCVWKVRRSGIVSIAERPEIETFGESVGILTREIFGLEVAESGFHRLLTESVESGRSYEQIVSGFGGELGGEAKGIIRGLIADRDQEDDLDVEN
ncbi:MAG: AAA family ATPase [Acidobacteriaceae bacterium]|nr:AAA family ATPase [Acidobacteriaceae bacterium]